MKNTLQMFAACVSLLSVGFYLVSYGNSKAESKTDKNIEEQVADSIPVNQKILFLNDTTQKEAVISDFKSDCEKQLGKPVSLTFEVSKNNPKFILLTGTDIGGVKPSKKSNGIFGDNKKSIPTNFKDITPYDTIKPFDCQVCTPDPTIKANFSFISCPINSGYSDNFIKSTFSAFRGGPRCSNGCCPPCGNLEIIPRLTTCRIKAEEITLFDLFDGYFESQKNNSVFIVNQFGFEDNQPTRDLFKAALTELNKSNILLIADVSHQNISNVLPASLGKTMPNILTIASVQKGVLSSKIADSNQFVDLGIESPTYAFAKFYKFIIDEKITKFDKKTILKHKKITQEKQWEGSVKNGNYLKM